MCFTSQIHKAFLRAIFAPVGHRLNVLVRRRAPAALSIACPLFGCIWPIMDHVAVWCGLTPSTIGNCFSSPVHQYFTRSFEESIVFRLGLTCIRVWWGVFTLIYFRGNLRRGIHLKNRWSPWKLMVFLYFLTCPDWRKGYGFPDLNRSGLGLCPKCTKSLQYYTLGIWYYCRLLDVILIRYCRDTDYSRSVSSFMPSCSTQVYP
jgi:hypothetical protein